MGLNMDMLKHKLDEVNESIRDLEDKIQRARLDAENNIAPLNVELAKVKEDKRNFAYKNDSDSVHDCIRKEENLKFKINAQWNEHAMLKNELAKFKRQKLELESQIKLEEDKIKRHKEIVARMDEVLDNYRRTQNLKQSAMDAGMDPNSAEQWFEWGRNDFNETYSYFYNEIIRIDNHFKDLEAQKLKEQMDRVVDAYRKTGSLRQASRIADVSYDTVQYWYEWGSRGFGEENTYFFKNVNKKS
jgi:hypothetical protein